MMQDCGFELIRDRLEFYRKHSDAWKDDHDQAMACFKLEEVLAAGIESFRAINRVDEFMRSIVASGKVEYDPKEDAKIEADYQWWKQKSAEVIVFLEQVEKRGFDVRGAEDFRRCYREVQDILTPDKEFFVDDALVRLRDEAIDAHRRNDTVEIKDLSD